MISRLAATRQILQHLKNGPQLQTVPIRNHGYVYRGVKPPNKRQLVISEVTLGIMWWWILWHMWTEPELVFGEWPDIDASKWTDEDLGIPPDDVGPAPRIQN